MDRTCSYEVVVKNSAKAVIKPLNDCICSINWVSEALINADVDPVTGQCSNYDYIRQQIVQAWRSLQHSDEAATTCLRCLDESLETLTQDEGTLGRQKNSAEHSLGNLRTKQASNEKLLGESLVALEQARTNLRSTRDTLESQERRVQTAKTVGLVGLGLSVIPIVGWVAGPMMVIGGAIEMAEASHAIEIAEEELEKYKNRAEKYAHKVRGHVFTISQTRSRIGEIDRKLTHIREDIHVVKKQRWVVAELQRKVRTAVHLLSVLIGKVSVFERQTRRFILHGSMIKVMEEVMGSTEEIAGNELLCNRGMVRLLHKMKENKRRLRSVCALRNNDEDDCLLLKYI
ncbi:hypothetical protein AMELA_G00163430 [Ameiurus melas]|uniref:Uncharacterized protein n=1 Tax=Ameiurus melas TaxID=219545 RepID=A0A7J6AHT4_AMEME|nr:hypothetical protein AMELA_G00163430 [Ameiurus melas]